ncbi:hypothetical protein BN2475_640052 [Paraburkholderia ribeironis]|uniref:Uncharacterized protein n=1 Tax=Paraburkholderia ribeironis TaxID=1247936 RepID=A0A1N7SG50_9BURK|nr:hypothetical protein BN2475_640052 [Paraburkholderia ribeironis]
MPFGCTMPEPGAPGISLRKKPRCSRSSKPTGCLPSSASCFVSRIARKRGSIRSGSISSGRLPSSPSSTALSVPCPLPVAPSEPNSSIFTRRTKPSRLASSICDAKRHAAIIGPTVCELEGPIPILKRSKTLTFMACLVRCDAGLNVMLLHRTSSGIDRIKTAWQWDSGVKRPAGKALRRICDDFRRICDRRPGCGWRCWHGGGDADE